MPLLSSTALIARAGARIQARTAGMSTRWDWVTPVQLPFVTYELTARTGDLPQRARDPARRV